MENPTRRLCFNLNGLMGGLIATVLLLAILFFLTSWDISVQKANAQNYYKIKDPQGLKFNSPDNAKHYELVK
ncbi:MAG: DUF4006 family protein [Epsilonproteobacteria bacterium]|nr:DUF4006 family protein [Campylobacterota bacterium]